MKIIYILTIYMIMLLPFTIRASDSDNWRTTQKSSVPVHSYQQYNSYSQGSSWSKDHDEIKEFNRKKFEIPTTEDGRWAKKSRLSNHNAPNNKLLQQSIYSIQKQAQKTSKTKAAPNFNAVLEELKKRNKAITSKHCASNSLTQIPTPKTTIKDCIDYPGDRISCCTKYEDDDNNATTNSTFWNKLARPNK